MKKIFNFLFKMGYPICPKEKMIKKLLLSFLANYKSQKVFLTYAVIAALGKFTCQLSAMQEQQFLVYRRNIYEKNFNLLLKWTIQYVQQKKFFKIFLSFSIPNETILTSLHAKLQLYGNSDLSDIDGKYEKKFQLSDSNGLAYMSNR